MTLCSYIIFNSQRVERDFCITNSINLMAKGGKPRIFGQAPFSSNPTECNNIFKIFHFFLVKTFDSEPERQHVCIDCGEDKITRTASSPEARLIRESAELTWNRGGDVHTTEKVICSPWIHPSGIQQHKPNLSQHQHIINPHTWLY